MIRRGIIPTLPLQADSNLHLEEADRYFKLRYFEFSWHSRCRKFFSFPLSVMKWAPFTGIQIRELIAEGKLQTTESLRDGDGNWILAHAVCGGESSDNFGHRSSEHEDQSPSRSSSGHGTGLEMQQLIAEWAQQQQLRHQSSTRKNPGTSISLSSLLTRGIQFPLMVIFKLANLLWTPFQVLIGSVFRGILLGVAGVPRRTEWSVRFSGLIRSRYAHGIVVVGLILSAGVWVLTRESLWMTQPKLYEELAQIWDELKAIRTSGADSEELLDFQLRSEDRLKKLIPLAESMVADDDRVSLSLMWIARDYLPVIVGNAHEHHELHENKLETQLSFVQFELQRQVRPNSLVELSTLTMIVFDVCMVSGIAWWMQKP